MKKLRLSSLLFMAFFAFSLTTIKAQIVGPDAYIQGSYVEIGLNGLGGYEGTDTVASMPPAGYHSRSNTSRFGFVANPQMNLWTTFDGDFFTPGTPENGWGFEIDTLSIKGQSNCSEPGNNITGAIMSWNHIGTTYSVDWEGDFSGSGYDLHFLINYKLEETDHFYTTTISVTNNTASTIPNIFYYRNLDPDNNVMLTSDYSTQNTIVSQHTTCTSCVAHVSATQSSPWYSYYALVAIDTTDWKAGYGGFTNRDGSDLYYGLGGHTQTVGAINLADEAIYLSYRIQNLIPGGTETFKFCSVFDAGSVGCAIASGKVSFAAMPNVCTVDAPFTLTGGSPAGGTYFGTGVSGSTFDPATAGAGNHIISYTYTDSSGCSTSVLQDINVDVCAGVDEGQSANQVSVYPNPFTESTTITIGKDVALNNAQFLMYDVLGKEVINIKDIRSKQFNITKNTLESGVYFFKLINNNKEIGNGKLFIK